MHYGLDIVDEYGVRQSADWTKTRARLAMSKRWKL
jgi:hypothetical protein